MNVIETTHFTCLMRIQRAPILYYIVHKCIHKDLSSINKVDAEKSNTKSTSWKLCCSVSFLHTHFKALVIAFRDSCLWDYAHGKV